MTKEELTEIIGMIGMLHELRPVVQVAIKSLQVYGPELKELFGGMQRGLIDMRIDSIRRYQEAGFTIDQAIDMTMDEWFAYRRALTRKSK